MSIEPNKEFFPHAESHKDPTILVQTYVIERLHLDDDLDAAAIKYMEEGYSKKCREIMESDLHVQALLEQGDFDQAATLLTSVLQRWKQMQPSLPMAA